MSHVLLGGDEQKLNAVRCLLTRWGVTAGRLAFVDNCPTVQDCDAVIIEGNADRYRDACLGILPDGPGGAAGPAAPLIFINSESLNIASLPAAWLVLDRVDEDGANLRAALNSAVASARSWRGSSQAAGGAADADGQDAYLHFLGHELRSPLTAIKTSLEVLEGELGGLDHNGPRSESGLKMVGIALRNVRRLHKTVEWSQDLLAAGNALAACAPREVALAELAVRLQGLGEVRLDEAAAERDLQTDPELLTSAVTQMARAVGMAHPDSPLSVRLGLGGDDADLCQLVVAAADGEHGTVARGPERTRLVVPAAEDGPTGELARLARFMVAGNLLDTLGARLMTTTEDAACPALVLCLALQPALQPA